MSSGLMSCVRENSPPLELDDDEAFAMRSSGPFSLPSPSARNMSGSTSTPVSGSIKSSTMTTTGSEGDSTSGAGAVTSPDQQQKRRRFHPLRNLRRIFRRRTITSVDTSTSTTTVAPTTTPTSSTSEKNLRSATLSASTSVASASSPSSPLTQQQLLDAYSSQSLPKSKSYSSSSSSSAAADRTAHRDALLSKLNAKKLQSSLNADDAMYTTTTSTHSTASYHQQQQQQHHYHHTHAQRIAGGEGGGSGAAASGKLQPTLRQPLGVAVLPVAMSRSFYAERQKLRSVDDSLQDLDSSGNDSGSGTGRNNAANGRSGSGGEMTDSQRSLSEGRLVDSDSARDALSQSHDSVFSESATASSLSIVLKAELADALRKRRNRPDASDEDLGLPRSPASPQRRGNFTATAAGAHHTTPTTAGNQSDVSSLSLLSMNSTDGEECQALTSTPINSMTNTTEVVKERTTSSTMSSRYARSMTMSSMSVTSDVLRHSTSASFDAKDEVDLFSSDWQRLSHAAAKHKMAVRPAKKKVPSRQHRRTLENSIPEANEDNSKLAGIHLLDVVDHDAKAKTRSLPPGINAKTLEQHAADNKHNTATITSNAITAAKPAPTSSASGNPALSSKRTRTEKVFTTVTTSSTAQQQRMTTTTTTTTSASSAGKSTATATNLFGLRTLSANATAIFEPKETAPAHDSNEIEPSESGFLRRLMQRNSKRSIAKTNNGAEDALDQSEPKKLQISTSCLDATKTECESVLLNTSQSSMTCGQHLEKTRKEIKREIMSEGKIGMSAMTNSYMLPNAEKANVSSRDSITQKPKSGPAARQRYMPQEIMSSNTLEKKASSSFIAKETASSTGLLAKQSHHESFQSTSIIREITAAQSLTACNQQLPPTASKSDHHFEKKPKIVGLSAFQQKISRSNDSFTRTSSSNNNSSNSLETAGADSVFLNPNEQKQRKSVEKSRSFRTYNEEHEPTSVHSNMPSLPDLSLNLRVPFVSEFILNEKEYSSPSPPDPHDKSVSLGFEINDNNLVRPANRSESAYNLPTSHTGYSKNVIMTTATGISGRTPTPTRLLTPASVVPNLSPSTSCNQNISEIEQNIDMIVKSPFVSVLRKSANINDDMAARIPTAGLSSPTKVQLSPQKQTPDTEIHVRPKVLNLNSRDMSASDEKLTPTTAAVPLRNKTTFSCTVRTSSTEAITPKEIERKSAPNTGSLQTNSFKSTIRSSSVVEAIADEPQTKVPEFLKIQLNRVDPVRLGKSNVVLSKNVKDTSTASTVAVREAETSASTDDLSLRRYSNESVDINEKETPEEERHIAAIFEAVNKQAKSVRVSSNSPISELPPKSPVKKQIVTPVTPTTPCECEDTTVLLRSKPNDNDSSTPKPLSANKLSVQERKRLFLNEEKAKTEKRIEELRNERKKSINEELNRKSFANSMEKLESPTLAEAAEHTVVLRKKSFGSVSQSSSCNGSTSSSSNNNNQKDDPTPELMKVFARRSLKVKDEDLTALADKLTQNNSNSVSSLKKHTTPAPFTQSQSQQQNVDSDKENQSSSEEKLDKLPKFEVEQLTGLSKVSTSTSNHSVSANTRSSLTDFRNGSSGMTNKNTSSISNGHTGLTVSNHNNNNATSPVTPATPTLVSNGKSCLPPIRANAGFRAMPIERNDSVCKIFTISQSHTESLSNNNNNQQTNTNTNSNQKLERQSLNIKNTQSATSVDRCSNKTIERSATVGEFKGILQRRAEWEQRAKEALK